MRKRIFKQNNYMAFYHNGKTIRQRFDESKPITKLEYPEFYDVAINSKCYAGCNYCYVSAKSTGENYKNIVDKAYKFFGHMSDNERPFSVAIGGHGEPTLHPYFVDFLWALIDLGITPNYTTNGQHLTEKIIQATIDYVGGVAVSTHPHLDWVLAADTFIQNGIIPHLHVIISDKESVNNLLLIKEQFSECHIVLLPYQTVGRARQKELAFDYLFEVIQDYDKGDFSFGAYFLPYLQDKPHLNLSLYDEGVFSAYLKMDNMKVYNSSYDLTERVV